MKEEPLVLLKSYQRSSMMGFSHLSQFQKYKCGLTQTENPVLPGKFLALFFLLVPSPQISLAGGLILLPSPPIIMVKLTISLRTISNNVMKGVSL